MTDPGPGGRPAAVAVLLAAGSGIRIGGDRPKAFLSIGDRSLLTIAADAACAAASVASIVVAVPDGWEGRAAALLPAGATVIAGGSTRQESVRIALRDVGADVEVVVCHDTARALCMPELFDRVVAALTDEVVAVVPVVPVPDTVKRTDGDRVVETVPRVGLALAQTPQAFRRDVLIDAHRRAADAGFEFTDDAALIEWLGGRVRTVPGDPRNFKVTTAADLEHAAAILSGRAEAAP